MGLNSEHIYAVVGANTETNEILSLHTSYEAALENAQHESEVNEDWCLIKVERLV